MNKYAKKKLVETSIATAFDFGREAGEQLLALVTRDDVVEIVREHWECYDDDEVLVVTDKGFSLSVDETSVGEKKVTTVNVPERVSSSDLDSLVDEVAMRDGNAWGDIVRRIMGKDEFEDIIRDHKICGIMDGPSHTKPTTWVNHIPKGFNDKTIHLGSRRLYMHAISDGEKTRVIFEAPGGETLLLHCGEISRREPDVCDFLRALHFHLRRWFVNRQPPCPFCDWCWRESLGQ